MTMSHESMTPPAYHVYTIKTQQWSKYSKSDFPISYKSFKKVFRNLWLFSVQVLITYDFSCKLAVLALPQPLPIILWILLFLSVPLEPKEKREHLMPPDFKIGHGWTIKLMKLFYVTNAVSEVIFSYEVD